MIYTEKHIKRYLKNTQHTYDTITSATLMCNIAYMCRWFVGWLGFMPYQLV